MHEIGVLEEAVKTVVKIAEENKIEHVAYITLEIGELSGYLPVFFEKYFPIVTEDRPVVKDAKLHMQIIPGEALCTQCHTLYNVMKQEGKCPKCKSREKKILGGQEFLIKDIGY